MVKLVGKLYKPSELEDVQAKVKEICDAWFGANSKPPGNLVNTIITELHKRGYRIVKVG